MSQINDPNTIMSTHAIRAIEYAYDSFPKEEFLHRLCDYIRNSIELAIQQEKLNQSIQKAGEMLGKKP